MSIWPEVEHGGFATKDLVTQPKARVTAACYLPGVRTPLHVHPQHDQCVLVADGVLHIITDEGRISVETGTPMIVRAGKSHAFESGTGNTRFLSIFLGDGASKPGKTALPDRISRLLDPRSSSYEQMVETLLSPDQVGRVENLTETERETLNWVTNRLLKRIETGRYRKNKFRSERIKKAQAIMAWQKDNHLYLWATDARMMMCLTLKRGERMNDYIKLNDIDVYWPHLNMLPEVEVIK
ncbi:MAG: cupin domain-containing protein [Candidatus Uhrbacteria bacterium]|nr:cupin domain-containing protein [Patescibacteria group bacterium]MBU1906547.1 cupin domain-containing protein [Patescibacteria group bacterium]